VSKSAMMTFNNLCAQLLVTRAAKQWGVEWKWYALGAVLAQWLQQTYR